MAATTVRKMFSSRSASEDQKSTRRFVEEYYVETDVITDDGAVAVEAVGIRRGTSHPSDVGALAVSVASDPVEGKPFIWRVLVTYASDAEDPAKYGKGADPNSDTPSNNPTDWRPERVWRDRKVNVAVEEDKDGFPIITAAGEKYDPPLEVERPLIELEITRNEAAYDPANIFRYVGRVNSATFYTAAPGQVKCDSITYTEAHDNGIRYVKVRYLFTFKIWPYTQRVSVTNENGDQVTQVQTGVDGWQPVRLLHMGTRAYASDLTTVQNITDDHGNPPSAPVLLAEDGTKLPVGGIPNYRTYSPFPEADFGPLRLEFA